MHGQIDSVACTTAPFSSSLFVRCTYFQECYQCGENTSYHCYAKPATVIPLVISLTVVVLMILAVLYYFVRRQEKIDRASRIPSMIMGSDSSRWFRLVVFCVMGSMVFAYAICSFAFIPFNKGTGQDAVDSMFWVLTVVMGILTCLFAVYLAKANSSPITQPLMSHTTVFVDGVYASPYNPNQVPSYITQQPQLSFQQPANTVYTDNAILSPQSQGEGQTAQASTFSENSDVEGSESEARS